MGISERRTRRGLFQILFDINRAWKTLLKHLTLARSHASTDSVCTPRGKKRRLSMTCTRCANDLYNVGLYNNRQYYFTTGEYLPYANSKKPTDNYRQSKGNWNYRMLQTHAAQQALRSVDEAFRSFFALNKLWKAGELSDQPRMPHYRNKGGLSTVEFPMNHIVKKGDKFKIPMSKFFMTEHKVIKVPYPEYLIGYRVKEIKLVPYGNGYTYYLHYSYQKPTQQDSSLDPAKAIAIDLGVGNLAAVITTEGSSFIIDGRQAKRVNKKWNDDVARIQSALAKSNPNGKVEPSRRWWMLNDDRANYMNDYMAKTARILVDYCLEHKIGTMIVGWNKGIKTSSNMGRKNNQSFVQIPHGLLIRKLEYLCKEYGIRFELQEESYTSKASFLDNDNVPVYGQTGRKIFSGKRTKRGLYRTAKGKWVNADVNGACNTLRKCADRLGDIVFSRSDVAHGLMANPTRIRIS